MSPIGQRLSAGSQYVVLSAQPVVELPPGNLFMPSDVINVPAGTVVTLLGEDGSVNPISVQAPSSSLRMH
jgi:hypothetical protein